MMSVLPTTRDVLIITALLISTVPAECQAQPAAAKASAQPAKPAIPVPLKPPPAPSSQFGKYDLTKIPAADLASASNEFYRKNQYPEAVQFAHYALKAGAHQGYNLACYHARAGNKDAALYWLQETALDEGVDATWAENDPDLAILRKDTQWSQVSDYLKACNAYWAASGHHKTTLVVPKGYNPRTPIGVLIGMHGRGGGPEGFVTAAGYQKVADDLNMAVVGVSGTLPRGKYSFVWSENPERDATQINSALAELKGKLTPAPGKRIAFGFSQGAQMAFEVAFAYPSDYQGAIVMSPGTTKRATLRELKPTSQNKEQTFVVTCGADEHPGNVRYTRMDADFAKKAGSRADLQLYKGVETHSFPADFRQAFPRWVRYIRRDAIIPK